MRESMMKKDPYSFSLSSSEGLSVPAFVCSYLYVPRNQQQVNPNEKKKLYKYFHWNSLAEEKTSTE